MTQSNKTFRKSSLHSWTAALLALLALAGCGALWIVVGQLEQEFGSLIRDRAGYEQRLQEIRAEVAAEELKRGQVWDHRQQLRSDTAEAEATLAQLRAQANAVEETKGTLEADLLGLEEALAARQAQLDAALASIDEAARLEDRIADLRRQSQTLTKAVTAAEQDHDDVQAALSAAETQRARLNAEVADAEGDLARVKDELAARQDDLEGLKAEIVGLEALRAEKAGLEATLAELKDDRAELDRALAALTQEVETLQLAADDIGPRVVGFRTDRDQLREEVAQARADLATSRSARQLAEQQQRDAERAKDTAEQARDSARQQLTAVEQLIRDKTDALAGLDDQLVQLAKAVSDEEQRRNALAARVARLQDQETALAQQVPALQASKDQLAQEAATVAEQLAAARQELASVQSALQASLDAHTGLLGRMGVVETTLQGLEQRQAQAIADTEVAEVGYQTAMQRQAEADAQAAQAERDLAGLRAEADLARARVAALRAEETSLTERIEDLTATEARLAGNTQTAARQAADARQVLAGLQTDVRDLEAERAGLVARRAQLLAGIEDLEQRDAQARRDIEQALDELARVRAAAQPVAAPVLPETPTGTTPALAE